MWPVDISDAAPAVGAEMCHRAGFLRTGFRRMAQDEANGLLFIAHSRDCEKNHNLRV